MKTKTLFLDFDGVLHPMSASGSELFQNLWMIEQFADLPNFEVVISSSWRFHYPLEALTQRLGKLQPIVVGATGDAVIGKHARHREILGYCVATGIGDWRALDDSQIEFPLAEKRLFKCNPRTGLTMKELNFISGWLKE